MTFTIKADPYQTNVIFCLGDSHAQIASYLRRVYGGDDEHVRAIEEALSRSPKAGLCLQMSDRRVVVWTKDVPTCAADIAIVTHECYHAACYILRGVGMVDGEPTEEAWAYLVQHLVEESTNRIGAKHWTVLP